MLKHQYFITIQHPFDLHLIALSPELLKPLSATTPYTKKGHNLISSWHPPEATGPTTTTLSTLSTVLKSLFKDPPSWTFTIPGTSHQDNQ